MPFYSKGYIRLENTDCLAGQDLFTLSSNENPNYETCKRWCSTNNSCTAFAVNGGSCYFKNWNCQSNQNKMNGVTTFALPSKAITILISYFTCLAQNLYQRNQRYEKWKSFQIAVSLYLVFDCKQNLLSLLMIKITANRIYLYVYLHTVPLFHVYHSGYSHPDTLCPDILPSENCISIWIPLDTESIICRRLFLVYFFVFKTTENVFLIQLIKTQI